MIQSLPLPVFLIMLAFPLAMAGIVVFAGVHARKRAALVKSMPTSKIRTAKPGYCEFEGKVEAIDGRTLTSPLTLSPCCWYRARVEKWQTYPGTKRSAHWETVRDVTSCGPFFVRDATGVCAVDPDGAEVTPTDHSLWHGASEEPDDRNPPRVPPTESAKGWIEISGGPNSRYRYSEKRIYDGDPLFALGLFSNDPPATAASGVDDDLDPDEDGREDETVVDIVDELNELAARITPNRIARGSRKQPLVLSTMPQDAHVALMEQGGFAAFVIAIVPLAMAAWLLWARFG